MKQVLRCTQIGDYWLQKNLRLVLLLLTWLPQIELFLGKKIKQNKIKCCICYCYWTRCHWIHFHCIPDGSLLVQGIAKRLVEAALHKAAKNREMSYSDLKKIEHGVRRHFHDDITVIVLFLDHDLIGKSSHSGPKLSIKGGPPAPVGFWC